MSAQSIIQSVTTSIGKFWLRSLSRVNPKLLLFSALAGIILTAFLMSFKMNIFEASLYDFRMRNQGTQLKDPHVVMIAIDDASSERLDESPPFSIGQHLKALKILGQAKPKAVSFFINFNESVEPNSPQMAEADEFVKTAESLRRKGINVYVGTDFDVTGEVLPPFPISKLPHKAAILHKDAAAFSEDKVTRRAILSVNGEKTLHTVLAEEIAPRPGHFKYHGLYYVPEVDAEYFLVNFVGPTQDDRQLFDEISFSDLLDGKISADRLNNKIVLIGTRSRNNSNDYAYTPFSRELFTNGKLGIHASIIETLILNNSIMLSAKHTDWVITFLLTTFIVWMVFQTTPLKGVNITIALALIYLALSLLLFRYAHLALNMSRPLLGIFFAYYVFVPYRLIMEFKKRSEFQRQHEVLMQVDELKRNFMSLITHDLKTPVARIQGMAEILGRSGSDIKLVDEIVNSTEELNRFLTSILELARVESNEIKVQRVSKDINKLIEDCVKKLEFEARRKGIAIELNLEPLFSIPIDAPLVSRVIANLVDNALKYSPANSTITVTSRESIHRPGGVEVSVTDNGHGIDMKDQKNLFVKFYRPQNDMTMKTKGYGLGLYLSRYFIELHDGFLTVESEPEKGSTFTMYLPEEIQDQAIHKNIQNVTKKADGNLGGSYA